ncbi:hypothetical protein BFF78_39005 [Streptomyces fodineus]|uniref:Uncharacterized protein n=1 Tax=Streptomyces fodineus TaxID=1904616 RepID=A0A1D7YKX1_9ACTN|nr:hypothetical protein [Streptomyces fodineus]AOR36253.1 hypothetical protein BFF78_39005 [Streptomyces fodineus]
MHQARGGGRPLVRRRGCGASAAPERTWTGSDRAGPPRQIAAGPAEVLLPTMLRAFVDEPAARACGCPMPRCTTCTGRPKPPPADGLAEIGGQGLATAEDAARARPEMSPPTSP